MDIEKEVAELMTKLMATPQGRAEVQRVGERDIALSKFQLERGITAEIAEAAIKEWVVTHNNLDWNLADVKGNCLRYLETGIPPEYLPESSKGL